MVINSHKSLESLFISPKTYLIEEVRRTPTFSCRVTICSTKSFLNSVKTLICDIQRHLLDHNMVILEPIKIYIIFNQLIFNKLMGNQSIVENKISYVKPLTIFLIYILYDNITFLKVFL
jgi:hypothetical protein